MQLVLKDGSCEPKEMKNEEPSLRFRISTKTMTHEEKLQQLRKELTRIDEELRKIELVETNERISRFLNENPDGLRNRVDEIKKRIDQIDAAKIYRFASAFSTVSPPAP
jgi:uncharacterized coiled-coil DUF342 family protein